MLYLLLSVLLFSYNNVLWKKNLKSVSVPFLITYRSFFTSIISLVLLIFFLKWKPLTMVDFTKITLGSLFGVIGLFSMLTVIKKTSLQCLGVYSLIGVVFTIIYLWIFDTIEIEKALLGLSIIVLGFVCFIHSNKESQLKMNYKQHALLTIMAFSFSLSAILHWRNLVLDFSPLLIIANQEFFVFLVGLVILLKQGKKELNKNQLKTYFKIVVLMSTVIFLSLLFNFLGLKDTNPIVSSILFLAIPLTTIMFSTFFFKEKLSTKNLIFIIIIAIGAFVLHHQSN